MSNRAYIKRCVRLVGGYEAAGRICNISGKGVKRWVITGRLPRTEATGETRYAEILAAAHPDIDKAKLLAGVFKHKPPSTQPAAVNP